MTNITQLDISKIVDSVYKYYESIGYVLNKEVRVEYSYGYFQLMLYLCNYLNPKTYIVEADNADDAIKLFLEMLKEARLEDIIYSEFKKTK